MLCPICKSVNVMRNAGLFTRDATSVHECNTCGFSFVTEGETFLRPSVRGKGEYKCFHCKKANPLVMNVPAMVPRLGLYCPECEKILCIWRGQEAGLAFTPGFFSGDWVAGYVKQSDPLKEIVQNVLCTIFLDDIPIDLKEAVEVTTTMLEKSKYISKRILSRERKERAKPKIEKKVKKAKKTKKKAKKKTKKTKTVKKSKGSQKTTPVPKDETARQGARSTVNDTIDKKKSQE